MSDVLRVRCPGCQVKIKVPVKYQGRKVNCPQCQRGLQIPRFHSESSPLSDAAAQSPAPLFSDASQSPLPDDYFSAPLEDPNFQQPNSSDSSRSQQEKKEETIELGFDDFEDEPQVQSSGESDVWSLEELGITNSSTGRYDETYGDVYDSPSRKKRSSHALPGSKDRRGETRDLHSVSGRRDSSDGGFDFDGGMLAGLGMMLLGTVLFFGFWALGWFYPYSLFLVVVGALTFFYGIFE